MTSKGVEVLDTHAGQQQVNDIAERQHGIWAAILPDFRFALSMQQRKLRFTSRTLACGCCTHTSAPRPSEAVLTSRP